MSNNEINELALAREMQLIYNHTRGFSPLGDGLNRWQGSIEVETPTGNLTIPIEILIPLKFPQYPPRIIIKNSAIIHPNVEKDGNVLLRITHEWKPDTHVYQTIHALQDLFKNVPPKLAGAKTEKPKAAVQTIENSAPENVREVDTINESITVLQRKIQAKDEEISKLRSELVQNSSEKITKIDDLDMILPADNRKREKILTEAQSVALADLLSTLDEKFKDGEISPVDFAKLYRRYSKELYIIHKKLEEL
ncbi:MAG: ubiquitin-conjugating enzyme E2 variant [Candidatus Thorarchaeota archaeon]